MTPGVRNFFFGFLIGVGTCMGFITYYGDLGGSWLISVGHKMKTAAQTDTAAYRARRDF